MRFSTEAGVGCVKSDPKSLLGYMMRSRKEQEEGCTIGNVRTITMVGERPNSDVKNSNVNNSDVDNSGVDFDMMAIHLDYPIRRFRSARKCNPTLDKR